MFRARRGRQGAAGSPLAAHCQCPCRRPQRVADDSLVAGLAVTYAIGILQGIRAAVRETISDAGVIRCHRRCTGRQIVDTLTA